jgi:uncharacterized membrane protein YkvI
MSISDIFSHVLNYPIPWESIVLIIGFIAGAYFLATVVLLCINGVGAIIGTIIGLATKAVKDYREKQQ